MADLGLVLTAGPYNFFYAAAFALAVALALVDGRRRGFAAGPWLALLACCVAGGVAGSKLLRFDLTASLPGEKTFLGGLLGGAVALAAGARWLRAGPAVFDSVAPAIASALSLGRIGCFLAGCCFGVPTGVVWGVTYGPATEAYRRQLLDGLIAPGASATLPVHPAQLYEAILAALLALLLVRFRSRLRRPGSAFLVLCAAYGAGRFALEFVRAGGGEVVLGLETVQWTLLVATAAALAALWMRERPAAPQPVTPPMPLEQPIGPAWLLVLGLLGTVAAGADFFTPLERLVVTAGLVPPVVALTLPGRARRFLWVPVLAAALAFTGQEPPAGDTALFYPRSFVTVGGAGMAGQYEETCGPTHSYAVGGVGASYTSETSPNDAFAVRAGVFAGTDEAQGDFPEKFDIRGGTLVGSINTHYVGFGAGATLGDLVVDGAPEDFIPTGHLRVGSLSGFFTEVRVADHQPAGVPAPVVQLGVGGRVDRSGSTVHAGISDAGFYFGLRLLSLSGYEVEPFLAIGAPNVQGAVAIRRRFPISRRNRPQGANP